MRVTRVYVDAQLTAGARITLEGNAASHITRVLRLRVGEALTLFDGRGGEYAAVIDHARGGAVTAAVGEACAIERESRLELTLAQGLSRGERMDLVVQKATELGASALVPVLTERSVVRLDPHQADRKWNHWRAIVIGACEQSGRNRLPELSRPVPLGEFLRTTSRSRVGDETGNAASARARLLLSPSATARLDDIPRPLASVTVLIGPEGGLSEAEEEAARTAGFTSVRLGPRVLRTETAALAALTLLQREFGDL